MFVKPHTAVGTSAPAADVRRLGRMRRMRLEWLLVRTGPTPTAAPHPHCRRARGSPAQEAQEAQEPGGRTTLS